MPAVLSLIPEDELPALVEEALLLPPIALGADEAVLAATPVTIFVPVARAAFEETLRQLRGGERALPPRVSLGLAPLKPMDLLEALVTPAGAQTGTGLLGAHRRRLADPARGSALALVCARPPDRAA